VPGPVARRDVEGKRALLHIAGNYDQLAGQAEAIRKSKIARALMRPKVQGAKLSPAQRGALL